jgi:prepilin peptidase CpaA
MSQSFITSLLPILMIMAAASDVTSYRIPNWLTALTAALFFPMALWTGMPMQEFGFHLMAGAILFVIGYLLFSFGLFGGGDAKLMAAAGLWFGPMQQTASFLVFTVLAGGLLTLAVAGYAMFELWAEIKELKFRQKLKHLKPKVPYGFALAVGAILAFPQTWWMQPIT